MRGALSGTHVFISMCALEIVLRSEPDSEGKQRVCMYQPCCVPDGSEDAAVAEDDDEERDEEDKGEEQHGVRSD